MSTLNLGAAVDGGGGGGDNTATISQIFQELCAIYYPNATPNQLGSLFGGLNRTYARDKSLVYSVIVVPSIDILYETEFGRRLDLHNLCPTPKDLKAFLAKHKIFVAVVDISYREVAVSARAQLFLKQLNVNLRVYSRFVDYLKRCEQQSPYKFNMLTWKEDLDDAYKLNTFFGQL